MKWRKGGEAEGRNDEAPELPERIRTMAQAYHEPPPVPRVEIWARLQAAKAARADDAGVITPSAPPRLRPSDRRPVWWLGLAALIALGVAIGRWTTAANDTPPAPGTATMATAKPRGSAAYAVATAEHLSRTETFLTSLRVGERTPLLGAQARDLLLTTRLLLDARGVTDPRTRVLLEDLELILVQITQLGDRNGEELDLITDGLEQRQMVPRLRSALPPSL